MKLSARVCREAAGRNAFQSGSSFKTLGQRHNYTFLKTRSMEEKEPAIGESLHAVIKAGIETPVDEDENRDERHIFTTAIGTTKTE